MCVITVIDIKRKSTVQHNNGIIREKLAGAFVNVVEGAPYRGFQLPSFVISHLVIFTSCVAPFHFGLLSSSHLFIQHLVIFV